MKGDKTWKHLTQHHLVGYLVCAELMLLSLPFLAAFQLGNGRGWQPKAETDPQRMAGGGIDRGTHCGELSNITWWKLSKKMQPGP